MATPMATWWRTGDGRNHALMPPLLSWMSWDDESRDLYLAGGIAHWGWGEDSRPDYIFPVYYSNQKTDSLLTPLWMDWQLDGERHCVIPPLLSGWFEEREDTVAWSLLGLYYQRFSNEPARRYVHLLPFFARNGEEQFWTPLFGWDSDERRGFTYYLTPLAGVRTGSQHKGSWLFPFYSHHYYPDRDRYRGTVLWGTYHHSGDRTRSGSSLRTRSYIEIASENFSCCSRRVARFSNSPGSSEKFLMAVRTIS